FEQLRMGGDDGFDERVSGPIEAARRRIAQRAKQLVDFDAQAVGQFVQRAGVWMVGAAHEAANGPLIEPGGLDDVDIRHAVPGHQAAKIGGDHSRVAAAKGRGHRNHGTVLRSWPGLHGGTARSAEYVQTYTTWSIGC